MGLFSLSVDVRLRGIIGLGKALISCTPPYLAPYFLQAEADNPWFTQENLQHALKRVQACVTEEALHAWAATYTLSVVPSRRVGLVLAGNIPWVGLHDLLAVLLSGHVACLKPSRRDDALMRLATDTLLREAPYFAPYIHYPDSLTQVDALVATGSSETVTHVARHFADIPHLLRGTGGSCAIVHGDEPKNALAALGEDVFTYFGLGCRSVNKLFVPTDYDITALLSHWVCHERLMDNARYAHHVMYQRAVLLAAGTPYIDGRFCLLQEEKSLLSPTGVLFYERYSCVEALQTRLDAHAGELQAMYAWKRIAKGKHFENFGCAQSPPLSNYADDTDTMDFLSTLNNLPPNTQA